jgi:endonuclease III
MARRPAPQRAAAGTLARLHEIHPDAHCELVHNGPFQLLVATVLSAQTTDRNVNLATPGLFARFPDARSLAAAEADDVAPLIASLSFYPTKARHLVALARLLVERHGGEVPRTMAELTALPGVGRKTANVVLGDAFGLAEGVVVDTHVQRLSQRLGWTDASTPEQIERDLVRLFPQKEWPMIAHVLIFHGRRVCSARSPACSSCGVAPACPSAGDAEHVGRKPPKAPKARPASPAPPAPPARAARSGKAPAQTPTRSGKAPAPTPARSDKAPASGPARSGATGRRNAGSARALIRPGRARFWPTPCFEFRA